MMAMNIKRKIAIIAPTFPPLVSGGVSSAHYNLYKALKSNGCNVKVFTYTDHSARFQEEDVFRHGTPSLLLRLLDGAMLFYKYALVKFEKSQQSHQLLHIVHSAVGSWKINKPLRTFNPEVLIFPDHGAPAYFIRRPANCRTVFISHHNPLRFTDEPLLGNLSKIDAKLASSIERKSLRKVDKIICPSDYMMKVFERTHSFKGPIACIPNLVDSELIASIPARDIRNDLSLKSESPLVYIPSAGSVLKGSRLVFEIIRRLAASYGREIGFYLSGGITDEAQKRELSFIPKNAKLYNPGRVSYDDNISVIKACSFCISPTFTESFGMAILEANFCGLPVVSFDVGGNADIVTTGVNGYLASFMDVEKLLSLSMSLLNGDLRKEMSIQTLRLVNDKFGTDRIVGKYMSYLFA